MRRDRIIVFLLRRRYLLAVLAMVLAAAMFHKSVLLVIPVYLTAGFLASASLKRRHYVAGGIFLCTLIFCQDLYKEIIFFFLTATT